MEDLSTGTRGSVDFFNDMTNFSSVYPKETFKMSRVSSKNTQGSIEEVDEFMLRTEGMTKSPVKGGIFELMKPAEKIRHPVFGLGDGEIQALNFNSGSSEIKVLEDSA